MDSPCSPPPGILFSLQIYTATLANIPATDYITYYLRQECYYNIHIPPHSIHFSFAFVHRFMSPQYGLKNMKLRGENRLGASSSKRQEA